MANQSSPRFGRIIIETCHSMAHDLLRGKPLELEWLSGAVVRRAEKFALPTPVHRAVYAALVLHAKP